MTLALADAKALPGLDQARRRPRRLGQGARRRDARAARRRETTRSSTRRPRARSRTPTLAIPAASALGELGDPRAAQPAPRRLQGRRWRGPTSRWRSSTRWRSSRSARSPRAAADRRDLLAGRPDAADRRQRSASKARRLVGKLSGDEARDALPEIEAEVADRRPRRQPRPARLVEFLADTVERGALGPPPRDRLRAAPARAGRPRAGGRAADDARARHAAHPRGARRGRLEAARARAADRRLPEAAGARALPRELLLAARRASTPASASSRRSIPTIEEIGLPPSRSRTSSSSRRASSS